MEKLIFNKIALLIIIMVCSGMLMGTPLQILSLQINILIIVLNFFLLLKIIFFKAKEKIKFNKYFSLVYIYILSLLPIVAAIMANLVFNQDFLSGLIGNMSFYNFSIIFYIYIYYKKRKNAFKEVVSVIMALGWISLIFFYTIRVLYPSLEFNVPSFDGTTSYTYTAYSLGSPCISWVGIIYLAKYKQTLERKFLLMFVLFISYTVVMQDARSYLLGLFICLFIFYKKELSIKGKGKFILNFLFAILFLLVIASIIPSIGNFLYDKLGSFQDAFKASSGKEVKDASANARISQVQTAYGYIKDNYLFGVGYLKASTQGQYIGGYFFPSDIGLIGVVFNYGIIGLIILLYQSKYFFKEFFNKNIHSNSFLLGTTYYMLIRYLLSIISGEFLYNNGLTFILLGILMCSNQKIVSNKKINLYYSNM